ncbi:hypothetical protein ABW21_db0202473 [Orbilia brochopaga]|nr:hypothetical protein ABW21_db0202473 [Drechslerella brochopaga]
MDSRSESKQRSPPGLDPVANFGSAVQALEVPADPEANNVDLNEPAHTPSTLAAGEEPITREVFDRVVSRIAAVQHAIKRLKSLMTKQGIPEAEQILTKDDFASPTFRYLINLILAGRGIQLNSLSEYFPYFSDSNPSHPVSETASSRSSGPRPRSVLDRIILPFGIQFVDEPVDEPVEQQNQAYLKNEYKSLFDNENLDRSDFQQYRDVNKSSDSTETAASTSDSDGSECLPAAAVRSPEPNKVSQLSHVGRVPLNTSLPDKAQKHYYPDWIPTPDISSIATETSTETSLTEEMNRYPPPQGGPPAAPEQPATNPLDRFETLVDMAIASRMADEGDKKMEYVLEGLRRYPAESREFAECLNFVSQTDLKGAAKVVGGSKAEAIRRPQMSQGPASGFGPNISGIQSQGSTSGHQIPSHGSASGFPSQSPAGWYHSQSSAGGHQSQSPAGKGPARVYQSQVLTSEYQSFGSGGRHQIQGPNRGGYQNQAPASGYQSQGPTSKGPARVYQNQGSASGSQSQGSASGAFGRR